MQASGAPKAKGITTVTNMLVIISSCSLTGQEITGLKFHRNISIDKIKNFSSAKRDSKLGDPRRACDVKIWG